MNPTGNRVDFRGQAHGVSSCPIRLAGSVLGHPCHICAFFNSHDDEYRTVLVPTMINLLTQFSELKKYDLTSLEQLAYGGSPMAPELIHRTREILPNLKLVQGYGLSEAGFSRVCRIISHGEQPVSAGDVTRMSADDGTNFQR